MTLIRSAALAAVVSVLPAGNVAAQAPVHCGSLTNAFGPFDYRKERGNNLHLVEMAHFTPSVEALVRSVTGYIGSDIDYTLRAFPNHHRALLAMQRLGERMKTTQVPRTNFEVECYYVRAVRFTPDDTVVRMLYARYLGVNKRPVEARAQLKAAEEHAGDNPFTYYNLGLTYLELGDPDGALPHARKALELGFPRTELKDRLVALNKWVEATVANEPAASSASAASAPAAAASR